METKPRVLIFVVAYEAEKTIGAVLRRIPAELLRNYELECLVIDDSSTDRTFEASRAERDLPFPLHVLCNPENQGYGGNQKIGYHYASANSFDFVVLLHGDGQYAPECMGDLLEPLRAGKADAVFGSRMLTPGAARRGGMPLYKYYGNKILSWVENRLLRTQLSEFHSGYRAYSVAALRQIPFECNANGFHFDTQIIIQLVIAHLRIFEVPIPTYYGDEICRVNGIAYGWNVIRSVLSARLQDAGIFYDRKYDCGPADRLNSQYRLKLGYESPHTMTLARVPDSASVLDLGCAEGYVSELLREHNHCRVTGVDVCPARPGALDEFILHDLNTGAPNLDYSQFTRVLLLDIVEHIASPERFVDDLRRKVALSDGLRVIVSAGNVAFFIVRLMLSIGQFNYGKRGILDLTHTRLFTFGSLSRLFQQAGFKILELRGVPGPFPLALGNNAFARFLTWINGCLIHINRGLFSYQIFMVLEAAPSVESLLKRAAEHSRQRDPAVDHDQNRT